MGPIKPEAEVPEIKAGQIWHIKHEGSMWVATKRVMDVTLKTVLLRDAKGGYWTERRYQINSIEFIELVSEANPAFRGALVDQ